VTDQAAAAIKIAGKPFGRPPNTSPKQKTHIILTKDLVQFSGRKMQNMLPIFAPLQDMDLSYKTIQRAYSNPLVKMIMHNMFTILVGRKGIRQSDVTGDGSGYSLTITKHYRSVREKSEVAAKSNESPANQAPQHQTKEEKRKVFTFAFAMMDLQTHMYVGYGASLRSEKAAFEAALALMRDCGVEPKSVRLDQYYAGQSTAEFLAHRLCCT
jgi:transposase